MATKLLLYFLGQDVKAEILLLNTFIWSKKGYEIEVVILSSLEKVNWGE